MQNRSANPNAHLVGMKCVLDGHEIFWEDDGHVVNAPEKLGSKRRKIERCLKLKDKSGRPLWYLLKAEESWSPGEGIIFPPVLEGMAPVWGEAEDARLETNLEERAIAHDEAVARVLGGAATVTGIGRQMASSQAEAVKAEAVESAAVPRGRKRKRASNGDDA